MPKQITGTNQTAIDLQLTIGVDGDNITASRHEENWQALLNNDATLQTRVNSFRLTTGAGIDGANSGVGVGAISISIPNDGIVTTMITDAAVTLAKLAANSVNASKIVSNAVTTAKIEDAAVTLSKIASAAVDSSKIADDAVITVKINDQAVVTAKIADGAITTVKIADGSVNALKLHATNTPTVGQTLVIGSNNRFTFEDKPSVNTIGNLVATGSVNASSGDVDTWTLESGLPSGIAVGVGENLLNVNGLLPMNFPKIPPTNRIIGLWVVLENSAGTVQDRAFLQWGTSQNAPGQGQTSTQSRDLLLLTTGVGTSKATTEGCIVISSKTATQWKIGMLRGGTPFGYANAPSTTRVKLYFALN